MIGHKDFPSRSGGVEVVVYELATRLALAGQKITVYNRGREKGHNRYRALGVNVRRIATFKKESLNAMVYSFLATLDALFRGYDIIHYHAIGPSVPLFLAHLFGKKTVSTVHGLNWRCDKWNRFASAYLKLGERIAARYADEVIVLSEEMHEYFMKTYARNTVLIKNAISPIQQQPCRIITEKFGLKCREYVLYIGRISPEKGPQDLIEAFRRTVTDKKLVIAGEMPDTDFIKEIKAAIGDSENIICTGFVSGDTMNELYSNAALYVLPSHTEGLALTLLEAMSCGARCMVSDIPENTAVLKDFGYTYHVGNIDSLAETLEMALSEPCENSRAEEQMKYIADNYCYDSVVEKTLSVYQKVKNGQ